MNKWQKETEKIGLDDEKRLFNKLKGTYANALNDVKKEIKRLDEQIKELIKQNPDNESLIRSKVYQLNYQKAMEEQLTSILNLIIENNINDISFFLTKRYEDSFLAINYHLQQKGIPVIMPINNKLVAEVLNTPIGNLKFTDRLYINNNAFKEAVLAEMSRGIATGQSYSDIARNIENVTGVHFNKTYRIVKTENGRVSTKAKMDSMRAAKKKGADIVKIWDSTLDGKTRPVHRELDGQWAEVDEPFKYNGGTVMHPYGFGNPSEDVNCRCALLSVPRWDIEDKVVKLDNTSKKLITCKNYEDWKQQYYKINESKKKSYKEVTKLWLAKATPNSHEVRDMTYFERDRVKYEVDGKNVVLDYSDKEKEVAEWLESTFGGELFMVPRINNPEGISTPDYLWNNEFWDLKEITGNGKHTLDTAIKKKKSQSSNFLFDMSNSKMSNDEAIKQLKLIFKTKDRHWIKKIMLIRNQNLIVVIERKKRD